jgi:hypothetical protein
MLKGDVHVLMATNKDLEVEVAELKREENTLKEDREEVWTASRTNFLIARANTHTWSL